jgi:hypothetical protein
MGYTGIRGNPEKELSYIKLNKSKSLIPPDLLA